MEMGETPNTLEPKWFGAKNAKPGPEEIVRRQQGQGSLEVFVTEQMSLGLFSHWN